MGIWGDFGNFGLGVADYALGMAQMRDQRERSERAFGIASTFPDQFNEGVFGQGSMFDQLGGNEFSYANEQQAYWDDIGVNPAGGYQGILEAGESNLFDTRGIDAQIAMDLGEYRSELANLQSQRAEWGELGSTIDMLGLADPMERASAVRNQGIAATGAQQEAGLRAFNENLSGSGDFDPFSMGLQNAFSQGQSSGLFGGLNEARAAGQAAQFQTEDFNVGARETALERERLAREGINDQIGFMQGSQGILGGIRDMEVDRGTLVQGGQIAENQRIMDAMGFMSDSAANSRIAAENRLASMFGGAELQAQGLGLGLQSQIAALMPEAQLNYFGSLQDIGNAAFRSQHYLQGGGPTSGPPVI